MFKLTPVTPELERQNAFFPGYIEEGIEEKIFDSEDEAKSYLSHQKDFDRHKRFYVIEKVQ